MVRTLTVSTAMALAAAVHAAPLVSVDLNNADTSAPTLTGFTPLRAYGDSTYSIGSGRTVRLWNAQRIGDGTPATPGTRDRGGPANAGSFTYGDLYRDFTFANTNSGHQTWQITFSGLAASTEYDFTFYSFDNSNALSGFVQSFAPLTGYTGDSGSIAAWTATPTTNMEYALTLSGNTDGSGKMEWTQSSSSGGSASFVVLNGFQISEVPEPAAFGLLGVAAISLMRRRRHH